MVDADIFEIAWVHWASLCSTYPQRVGVILVSEDPSFCRCTPPSFW